MALQFEKGESSRPRGHALLYFTAGEAVYATYLVVLPITIELAKYVPPMFASHIPQEMGAAASVIPLPPVPEQVESVAMLRALADARDDDLIFGGGISAGQPQQMLYTVTGIAQAYGASYAERAIDVAEEPAPELDPTVVLYQLMGERDRLKELAKLSGKLRYALEGGDEGLIREAREDLQKLIGLLPEKYRPADLLEALCVPGPAGSKLAELYVERCFKLLDEDYLALARIDREISEAAKAR